MADDAYVRWVVAPEICRDAAASYEARLRGGGVPMSESSGSQQ